MTSIAGVVSLSCGARTPLDLPGGEGGGSAVTASSASTSHASVASSVVSSSVASTGSGPGCEDPDTLLVYVVTASERLYRFDPPTGAFSLVGNVDCGLPPETTPYSMAVDRHGVAYVLYTDGEIFRVKISDASCEPTEFQAGQSGFFSFGMGFSSNPADGTETLFVAESSFDAPSLGLASIDTATLELDFIGPFSAPLGRSELTGTGDGKLFAYSLDDPGPGGEISELDKDTAAIVSITHVSVGDPQNAFAFASWGGAFYMFTALIEEGTTFVRRYEPDTMTLTNAGSLPSEIVVGAGVSTCAPS
ncbi:MAG: hypothetical protein U0414_30435 [Polyangiaceae bacterium]